MTRLGRSQLGTLVLPSMDAEALAKTKEPNPHGH